MRNISTVISKLQDLLATLEDNAIDLNKHTSDAIESLRDDNLCEDYRLHLKMFEMKCNEGQDINV